MFLTKNVINVVFKLLSADCTYHMILPRFWFINQNWMFLSFRFLSSHIRYIINILLIQKLSVLFSKLALFLQLENRCSIWCKQIEGWDVILTNVYFWAKSLFHLRLLLGWVHLEVVAFMSKSFVWRWCTTTWHVCCKSTRFKATYTVDTLTSVTDHDLFEVLR